MKRIYKYQLNSFVSTIEMPAGAEVLHVHEQDGHVCLWALIDPAIAETVCREFYVIGTGKEFSDEGLTYVGTAHFAPFVWHVFEKC